jgi:NADH-quinone oxidoreductase subunit L
LAAVAVAAGLLGIAGGLAVYLRGRGRRESIELDAFAQGWWIDSTYARIAAGPGRALFDAAATFDRVVIDGAVNGVGTAVAGMGGVIRRIQTGKVRSAALSVVLGATVGVAYVLLRLGAS